eukprot:TRINITY_DN1793_c0_g1_i11.p1 TRINITY_DN1793_c0_g1~~TRINITY_DN1793_c0_g1_i11.p1  ORF type:complete len:272 (-),score=-1.13 TRINITY_DN1793_c0_g1_i11:3-818(-)
MKKVPNLFFSFFQWIRQTRESVARFLPKDCLTAAPSLRYKHRAYIRLKAVLYPSPRITKFQQDGGLSEQALVLCCLTIHYESKPRMRKKKLSVIFQPKLVKGGPAYASPAPVEPFSFLLGLRPNTRLFWFTLLPSVTCKPRGLERTEALVFNQRGYVTPQASPLWTQNLVQGNWDTTVEAFSLRLRTNRGCPQPQIGPDLSKCDVALTLSRIESGFVSVHDIFRGGCVRVNRGNQVENRTVHVKQHNAKAAHQEFLKGEKLIIQIQKYMYV